MVALLSKIHHSEAPELTGQSRSPERDSVTPANSGFSTRDDSPTFSLGSPSPTLSPRLSDGRSAISSNSNTPSVPFTSLPIKHSLPDGEWLAQTLHPIHSVQRLPVELLALMFQWGNWMDPVAFPTLISQVSSVWRTLALSMSSLWTHVNLCGPQPYDKARLWISRALSSSSALLHICFDISEGFDPSPEEMENAMTFVLPYIDRWGSFTVRLDPDALQVCLETLTSLPETLRARQLKSLRIESTEFDAEDQWDNLFNDDLPALENIRLAGVCIPWNGPLFMKGPGLKHLHIGMFSEDAPGAPSLPELVAILNRNAQTLLSLTVDESNITHDVGSWTPELETELVLPNLERLQMTQLDRDVYFWMVRRLRCPKAVEYIGNPGQHDMEFNSMVAQQSRTSPFPNVRRLKIQYTAIKKGHFILSKMFRMLRKLESVEFYQCIICSQVGEALIWEPHDPRATALKEITFVATQGLTAEVLIKIVKSRREAERLSLDQALDHARPQRLERLILKGCAVNLTADDLRFLKLNVGNFEWSDKVDPYTG
ncbi:hypothetical protein FRB90_006942 [Tulasnella sp. 427]|nr:hypothetical protein FRB90_006942 [Tulasnella sp. 427]